MTRPPLIVANWKMNPPSLKAARHLLAAYRRLAIKHKRAQIVACLPAPYLAFFKSGGPNNLSLGGQNCFTEIEGPWTGEISPLMLKELGAEYVILGHSERRGLGETNEIVNRKVRAALRSGLQVIICVGEKERDATGEYLNFLRQQVLESLVGFKREWWSRTAVAYEPIWAIGATATGNDTPAGFLEQSIFIRKALVTLAGRERAFQIPILYGGSVNGDNAAGFLDEGRAAGLLVGRASLTADSFADVLTAS